MKVKAINKAVSLFVLLALLVGTIVPSVSAQSTTVAASSVRGTLVEVGAKHYLGLKVLDPSRPVKVTMDYRQDEPKLDGGAGFLVFDEQSFQRFIGGDNTANLAAGSVERNNSGLKQKIAIISNPVGTFSVVAFNDTGIDMDYTLTAENALIVDDSGEQVRNANAPVPAAEETQAAAVEETVATTPAAATTAAAPAATATATPAAPAAPAIPVITRAESLQGDLEEQYAKHYFDLSVNDTNKNVEIVLSYDPQDQQALDNGLNVYAYNGDQFLRLIREGVAPNRAENTASGTLTRVDGVKVMKASISRPFKTYTLIVGNDSSVPVSYTLTVANGVMVDASAQSNTAKARMAASAGAGSTTAATTTSAAATSATTTTTTTTAPVVAAGQVYVVKAGDTIATIARAAYGDINLWDELCAFNQLANCDRIEIGDEITVPAQSQLGTGAVAAPATAAATPAAAPAPAAAAPVTTTATTTETAPAATTAPVTTTTTTTGTTTTAPAATASGTVIDVATGARQFEILLLALSLANLTDGLKGAGPFTLFAPADAAFAGLPERTLDSLLADTAQLARVLQYHVVPQKLTAATITDGMTVTTIMGQNLTFAVSGGRITVNGANVSASELPASNGSVFIIDSVLLPAQ